MKTLEAGLAVDPVAFQSLMRICNDLDDVSQINQAVNEYSAATRVHSAALSFRERAVRFIESSTVQMIVIILILTDLALVITEVLMDTGTIHDEADVREGLLIGSLTILSLFLLELFVLMFGLGVQFFKHVGYVIDLVVVATSLVVDIAFHSITELVGIIIILRLWRVVRILHALAVAIDARAEARVLRLRHKTLALFGLLQFQMKRRKLFESMLRKECRQRWDLELACIEHGFQNVISRVGDTDLATAASSKRWRRTRSVSEFPEWFAEEWVAQKPTAELPPDTLFTPPAKDHFLLFSTFRDFLRYRLGRYALHHNNLEEASMPEAVSVSDIYAKTCDSSQN
eukprot:ANDGO_04819.mRNA.1 Voltage-gated hydrogen channel 1